MTTPFVAQLRVSGQPIVMGADGAARITVRVEMPEVWDTIRLDLPSDTPIAELKQRSLQRLAPRELSSDLFVLKLHGFEVLDESVSVAQAGGIDGSTFLLTNRRRRPIKG